MFAHFFIKRPVFACVISLVIILLGIVSMIGMPVAQFPEIVPPTVTVSANYPGASAEDVVNSVCIPIEQQINGVDDMIYISSSCSSDGQCSITVTFSVGTDPDMATVNVQNRVKAAEPILPEEVRRQGVNVRKRSSNIVMFLSIVDAGEMKARGVSNTTATDHGIMGQLLSLIGLGEGHYEHYEESGEDAAKKVESKDAVYLANYTDLYIKDVIQRVDGVGDLMIFNTKTFNMRIWLDPDMMAARKISVQEVVGALREQNVQVASGRIGDAPVPQEQRLNLPVVTLGRLANAEQFGDITLRNGEDGQVLKLRDVATVELGPQSYTVDATADGMPASAMGVMQRPGANSLHVAEGVREALAGLHRDMRRNGVDYFIANDATQFVRVSIYEVIETLLLAVVFVVGTVYVFLQDWRAALIPTLTIPVSLLGAFFFMMLFGFTINTLTLFGLILVIGIVVDDSIVVVENTQRIIDEEHCDSKDAAHKSMDQVASPVIATALVLMSVFIPTAMIGGIVGQIYKQFALTIAASIGISGICAMTLSPALCGIFLRPSIPRHKKFFGFRIFNYCFDAFAASYLFVVKHLLHVSLLTLILWFALIYGLYHWFVALPTGFIPQEDQGVVMVDIKLPDGASKERTTEVIEKARRIIEKTGERPVEGVPGETTTVIDHSMIITGFSMLDMGASSNSGFGIVTLKPWGQRRAAANHADAIANDLTASLAQIAEAKFTVFTPPAIMGLGMSNGLQLRLQDRRPFGNVALAETARDVIATATADAMEPSGIVVFGNNSFSPQYPRYYLDIDREQAKMMGIPLGEAFATLQAYYGSTYVNDFNTFNRVFRVTVQGMGEFRTDGEQLLDCRVKNNQGQMVPFRSFATLEYQSGPQLITRHNLYQAAPIMMLVRRDRSTGQGMERMEEILNNLPNGFGYEWTELSYQERNVGNTTILIFALSIVFAFLVLSAQYESWSTPIIIMMAVPLGVTGALTGVVARFHMTGMPAEINIYTQIGLILMVGLSAKNAILITEFARDLRHEGDSIYDAAYKAGRLRLRPIMMTSYAFILGVLPLALAKGAGAAGRQAIGTSVIGGMLTETMVGIFVTPILFVIIQGLSEWTDSHIKAILAKGKDRSRGHGKDIAPPIP